MTKGDYRILENQSEQSLKLNRHVSNQLPMQLKNQLYDIDFQKQLNFSKTTENINNNKKQSLISTNDCYNNESTRMLKDRQTNAPVPLMQLNLGGANNNNNQTKRLCTGLSADFTDNVDFNEWCLNYYNPKSEWRSFQFDTPK